MRANDQIPAGADLTFELAVDLQAFFEVQLAPKDNVFAQHRVDILAHGHQAPAGACPGQHEKNQAE